MITHCTLYDGHKTAKLMESKHIPFEEVALCKIDILALHHVMLFPHQNIPGMLL